MNTQFVLQLLTVVGVGAVIQAAIGVLASRKKTSVEVVGVKADNAGKVSNIAITQIEHINKRIADFQPQLAQHQAWDRGIVEQNRKLIRMLEKTGIPADELEPLRYQDPPSLWL